jgi:zinc transport system substrate-binding protein
MIVMKCAPVTRLSITAAMLAAPLLLAGCGNDASAGSGPRIVASFYPLQYVAERVAGDGYTVTNLTQPGKEPHDTELSIKESAELSDATLLFYEKGLASFVDEAVASAAPEHVVDAAASADLEGDDPHFWLDPVRLSAVAEVFEKELAKAEPDHAEAFAANLKVLQDDLAGLDQDLRTGLSSCALTTVVVSHDAFEYLGARYGLDLVSINGLSPEAEPSPAHIRELHDLIERTGITTVFSEELVSPELADALADDLGLQTAVLDPIEGLSDRTADEDYLSLMRKNLAALRKANDCT